MSGSRRGAVTALSVAAALVATLLAAPASQAAGPPPGGVPGSTAGTPVTCAGVALRVPGAARTEAACLADLTTAGTVASGHTDPADWAGLHAPGTVNPTGVPGIQLDGYFPDSSTGNTEHGWNHDSQFVVRLPDNWNGGLVIAGPPGNRRQYSSDFIIGDWVLAQGYAYASTDKGNVGTTFYADGRHPGDALVEWNLRVTQLTLAAKAVLAQRYHRLPATTLMTGISNGGYLVRWQLENVPWLYDGGVDWEGTLLTADGPSLLTFLPPALRAYPRYAAGDPAGHDAMLVAGFAPGSEPLWAFHYQVYWDLTQRIYREEFDPSYDGATEAGTPYCPEGTGAGCDTDYEYADRPAAVHRAMARASLTGRIGRPLITVHGTLDSLLPIAVDSDVYAGMVDNAGRTGKYRYYRITGGNHVDGLYPSFPTLVRPMLPCFRSAFSALTDWLAGGAAPPASHTVPAPTSGDPLRDCVL